MIAHRHHVSHNQLFLFVENINYDAPLVFFNGPSDASPAQYHDPLGSNLNDAVQNAGGKRAALAEACAWDTPRRLPSQCRPMKKGGYPVGIF